MDGIDEYSGLENVQKRGRHLMIYTTLVCVYFGADADISAISLGGQSLVKLNDVWFVYILFLLAWIYAGWQYILEYRVAEARLVSALIDWVVNDTQHYLVQPSGWNYPMALLKFRVFLGAV